MSNESAAATATFVMGDSIPALLAEEWMIQPRSAFPSFLEIMLIQQTERAIDETIPRVFEQIRTRARSLSRQMNELRQQAEEGARGTTTKQQHRWNRLLQLFYYRLVYRLAAMVAGVTERHNQRLLGIVLRYCVERQCLRRTGAAVAESIYGTKRVRANTYRTLSPLTTVDQTRLALLLAVGQPFVTSFWDECVVASSSRRSARAKHRYPRTLREALPHIWEAVKTTWNLGNAYFLLSYLVGQSYHTNMRDFAFGHVMRRVTQEDTAPAANTPVPKQSVVDPSLVTKASTVLGSVGLAITLLGWGLHLRSWYDEERRNNQPATTPVIPPPPLSQRSPSCPLCSQLRPIQPTAITRTGFVFCNVCIRRYVRQHQACPVTATGPITEQDLIRLYEPTNE